MKKTITFFCLCFMPTLVFAANRLEQQCYNKQISVNKTNIYGANDDDMICFYPDEAHTRKSKDAFTCFKADSNACTKGTIICMLGSFSARQDKNLQQIKNLAGLWFPWHYCAISYEGSGSDTWRKHGGSYDPMAIPDCQIAKWAKNDAIDKNQEIMVINNKPILSKNNYPMQYWIHYDLNDSSYPNVCVGYYCKGADGKYAEPCNDGTCDASCSSNTTTLPKGKGTSDKKVNNDAHIDIVTPYLDALKSKFDTLTI